MIRRLLATAIAVGLAAAGLDRWLAARARGREPRPIHAFVVIDAPPERVWTEVADIERQPRWMRDMKAVRLLTDGPVGVGTRGEATVRIFGIGVTDPVTVTAFEPPSRFAIRHEGAFTGGGDMRLEAGADGTSTIVRWDETLVPPVLPHLAAVLQAPILGRVFQADLGRLRDLIETRATSSDVGVAPAAVAGPASSGISPAPPPAD
jgi:uncharacterized protein YndB with AHSA1/START domain